MSWLAEGESKLVLASLSTIAKISNVDESTLKEFLSKYSKNSRRLSLGFP